MIAARSLYMNFRRYQSISGKASKWLPDFYRGETEISSSFCSLDNFFISASRFKAMEGVEQTST